ncbi:MAG: dehydrogenase, partial [Verrucomicrobia bacterium]|nr:dehydrogenase [Verrucomicrobiota bacterium]
MIKVFIDSDTDGKADGFHVFAEGFNAAMNLAFSKDGSLYVLCAWSLYALPDRDADGVCDEPELVLKLETNAGNPHGCWLGITFDEDGFMYLSRGNVGGDYYRIEGKDGSLVEGYGDGGNIVRAKTDGTELQEWATGFWNSMDLKFDHKGNLLLIDNDPDARGPNRLLRVVEGGDYGHKHMFGGSGRHPFQGWDGSFPGHLTYLSGTGEAPSGVIDVSGKGEHTLLISIWNENAIERHTILEDGEVEKSIFMSGGKDFRPVALDQDSDGNLFISDWMLVDYPNHGKGRIWRVSKLPIATQQPAESDPVADELTIERLLKSEDQFDRHMGEMWLAKNDKQQLAKTLTNSDDPALRLGGYLALRRMNSGNKRLIEYALADVDIEVRRLALLWAAESRDISLRPALDKVLSVGPVSPVLFNTYLAAVEMVNERFIEAYKKKKSTNSKKLPRELESGLLDNLARDKNLSAAVRAQAIKRLQAENVIDLLGSDQDAILLATINQVSSLQNHGVRNRLLGLALDGRQTSQVRAEALLALSKQILVHPEELVPLLQSRELNVANEAARTLKLHVGNSTVKNAFQKWVSVAGDKPEQAALEELAETALFGLSPEKPFGSKRPDSVESWVDQLNAGGDPLRGSRVFRSTQVMCTRCHAVDEGGTNLGPDLGGIAQSVTRAQIVRSILRPSDSFPPQYQAWNIYT